jgi:hypothetical protein
MNRIEQELFDLEDYLRRNDDIADNSAYLTIIDIANKVSELDAENAKLRELLSDTLMDPQKYCEKYDIEYEGWNSANTHIDARMRELGVVVDA